MHHVILRMVLVALMVSSLFTGCMEKIVEPIDVSGDIPQGETYSSGLRMIDVWYTVESVDAQIFAIHEPKRS
ncbi:MAG TPA: hypothetical protein PLO50_00015 [Nitrospira sp.]|nr:hypothetical protein [Nitrospira sp.]